MAFDKVVDSTALDGNLKNVANAIRIKGKTTASLTFPNGFISAIQTIQTGTELKIVVSTPSGAAVTATKGSNTVSGMSVNGVCTLVVPEAGTWSVKATMGGQTSETKTVSVVDSYAVELNFLLDNFADNDWASIIKACHSGSVPSTWVVGNSKLMSIGGVDYQIDIIGKNHDDYSGGLGKAPLTFQLHDCYASTRQMDTSGASNDWTTCAMRQIYLPDILRQMPAEVQNGIREVMKGTSIGGSGSSFSANKLFLLSEIEIFGSVSYSASGEGTQYDYYKAGNSKVKHRGIDANAWWARSPDAGGGGYFCYITSSGVAASRKGSDALGVAFGFCF